MALEECPHCLTSVMFSDSGICPSCGKKKYISSGKSREQIVAEQEKKDFEEKYIYYKKHGAQLMLGGILLIFASITMIVLFMIGEIFFTKPLFVGVFLGLGIAAKGYTEKREAKELKFFYEKKLKKNAKLLE
jgi:hypothetical protein